MAATKYLHCSLSTNYDLLFFFGIMIDIKEENFNSRIKE